jgi:hypothetical protein
MVAALINMAANQIRISVRPACCRGAAGFESAGGGVCGAGGEGDQLRDRETVFCAEELFLSDCPRGTRYRSSISRLQSMAGLRFGSMQWRRDKKRIGVTRLHLEEDAGKSLHAVLLTRSRSVYRLNRCGLRWWRL